jgi:hypothetical protein
MIHLKLLDDINKLQQMPFISWIIFIVKAFLSNSVLAN